MTTTIGVASDFAVRLRGREQLIGYWISLDNPIAIERLAGIGYDYIGLDGQHGVLNPDRWATAMLAVDARQCAGVIRVPSLETALIGAALDAGARAVIVPMIESADDAVRAVNACRHHPRGTRSAAGPVRGELRMGSVPHELDSQAGCIVMIETASALDQLGDICRTPGLDAVYVGPADLTLGLGGAFFGDPAVQDRLEEAIEVIAAAAAQAGIAAGIHCMDGQSAGERLAQGYTFATVSSDITHLQQAASAHLAQVGQQRASGQLAEVAS